jgi:hypothetical protein
MNNPWQSLEEIRGLSAVTAEWRQHTGTSFDAFKAGFLQKAGRDAKSYPCPHKPGCSHEVRPRGLGFVGICKDDDGTGCDDIPLTAEDVAVWAFSSSRLGRAIAWAFECQPIELRLLVPFTIQVASYSSPAISVLLTLPQNRDEFQQAINALAAESGQPFILFGATNRFVDSRCKELLERRKAEYFDLASHVDLQADGKLVARKPARELFARFQPGEAIRGDARVLATAGNKFCKAGSHWDVTFDGAKTFHLPHTLGAEYLNYLLHHPSEAISAYDLEMTIRPDKAKARPKDSVQNNLDADAIRDYLRQLDKLRAQREEATEDGDLAKADKLDGDIVAIENELKKNGQAPDAGERSRGNVSKAIAAVQRRLRKGDAIEKAFGQHLESFVSRGYECSYNQPQGNRWG